MHGLHLGTPLGEASSVRLERLVVAVEHRDPHAFSDKRLCDRETDAAGSAGDDRDASVEDVH